MKSKLFKSMMAASLAAPATAPIMGAPATAGIQEAALTIQGIQEAQAVKMSENRTEIMKPAH